ncbi:MAG: DoxX family protein [Betaproteobacteria bacterium]|nr:MAG: DoxX family protein [Betaproteobacteria bacterium]TMH79102.1 MAG: DoxX family protein [Betaproteobacteria bacterium]
MYGDLSWTDTAGRLLIVLCFLATGICNLTKARIKDHIERMAAFHTPFPAAVFWIGIALQFAGCALLLAGWHAEIGVYCLILFTVMATAIFHRFWSMPDPAKRNLSRIILLGNTGILGGLLLLLENVR